MKTRSGIRAVVCAAMCFFPTAEAQPFYTNLTNGSFESGFEDWTVAGNVTIETSGNPLAPYTPTDGTKLAVFNSVNTTPNGVLSRILIVPNSTSRKHRLRFDAGNLGFASHDMKLNVKVEVDGATHVNADITIPGTTGGATHWIACEYTFPTPVTGTVTVSFTDLSASTDAADLLLDHVRVDDSRSISIQASDDAPNPGVPITVSPADADLLGNGTTYFRRNYYAGEMVTLTAPPSLGAGRPFLQWVRDGENLSPNNSITFAMADDVTMMAVYQPGFSVHSGSGNPLNIQGYMGTGPFTPLITDYQIHNESAATIQWSAALDTPGTPWLTVWPRVGTLAPNESQPIKFIFNPAATTLPAGKLDSHVRLTTPSSTLDVPVSILIHDPDKVAVNGGFESGLASWTFTGHISLQSGSPYTATEGSSLVAFNALNSTPDGVLKQTLHTEIGVRYFLDFDAGVLAYNTDEQRMRLRLRDMENSGNPLLVDSVFPIFGTGAGNNVWNARHYEFTATSDLTEISFSDESNFTESVDLLLDHVRVYNPAYHINVTTSADENDPTLGLGSGDSLREALARAALVPGGNRITISNLVQIAPLPAALTVNSMVSIGTAGQTVTLHGYGFPGGLDVSAPTTIRDLILTGSSQSAVRNVSDLMLLDTRITDNSSSGYGGGFLNTAAFVGTWFSEGILVADRCIISQNHAAILGGGLFSYGDVALTRCTLDGNTTDGNGGGLANSSAFGGNSIMLDACTLSRNTAGGSGGGYSGITGYKSMGHMEAVNSTFSENSAATSGAAILTNGPVNLLHCTVSNNSCPSGQGGGIMETNAYGWAARLTQSIVAGNTAATDADLSGASPVLIGSNLTSGDPMLNPLGNHGGPTETMPPAPSSPAVDATLTILETPALDQRGNARISGAYPDLGAVELRQILVNTLADENDGISTGAVSLRDAVASNTTDAVDLVRFAPALNGGTIHLTHGVIGVLADYSLHVDGMDLSNGITVSGNHQSPVFNFLFSNATLRGITIADSSGSAVEAFTSHLNLEDCILRGNSSPYDGGALVVDDYFNGSASVIRCHFEQNTAAGRGGAIYNNSLVHISDSTFTNNHSVGNGGAIFTGFYRVGLVANNSTFTGNSANNGGAISAGSLKLVHSTLCGNQATSAGGGLFSTSTIPNPELGLSISNSIIAGNSAASDPDVSGPVDGQFGVNLIGGDPKLAPLANHGGRTMIMPPLPGSPVIDAATLLTSTPATDQRGWPRVSGATPDIGAVEVQQALVNTLVDENDGITTGGVSLREALLENTGSVPPWNSIQPHAEWIRFSPTLDGGTIDWNHGGAMMMNLRDRFVDGGDLPAGITIAGTSGFLGMYSCHNFGFNKLTFTGNTAMFVFEGGLSLKNCDFANMTNTRSGGALEIGRYGAVTIDGCNFLNSHSDLHGGAIDTKGQLTVRNSTFAGNSASGEGGAIHTSWEENRSTDISNCTFAGNTSGSHGGAISGFFTTLKHCTLSGNTAASGLGGGFYSISAGSDDPNVFENSIISGNTGLDLAGETAITWAHNFLGGNAKLAPLANYGGRTMTLPPLPSSSPPLQRPINSALPGHEGRFRTSAPSRRFHSRQSRC